MGKLPLAKKPLDVPIAHGPDALIAQRGAVNAVSHGIGSAALLAVVATDNSSGGDTGIPCQGIRARMIFGRSPLQLGQPRQRMPQSDLKSVSERTGHL